MLYDMEVKAHRKGSPEQNEVLQTPDDGLRWKVVMVSKGSEITHLIHMLTQGAHMRHNSLFCLHAL